MSSTYDSSFWLQRAQETYSLSDKMKDAKANTAMMKLAKKYQRIALRGAYDEAHIAFDSAREALRVSQGAASAMQIASLANTVEKAWEEVQKAGRVMEAFRRTHLLALEGEGGSENRVLASSAR